MNLRTISCITSLILGLILLNHSDPLLHEAGKGVMVLAILGFYSVLQLSHVVEEEDMLADTIEKELHQDQHENYNQRVA